MAAALSSLELDAHNSSPPQLDGGQSQAMGVLGGPPSATATSNEYDTPNAHNGLGYLAPSVFHPPSDKT